MAVSINIDWSIYNKKKNLDELGRIASEDFPGASVFSICEAIVGVAKAFGATLSDRTGKNFTSVQGKVGFDNIAIAYDSDIWEIHVDNELFVSMVGKYVGVVLYHKEMETYTLFVAVHMPIKGGQIKVLKCARDFTTEMINNGNHGITSAVMMGDWNLGPAVLGQHLVGYDVVLGEDELTTDHNSCDNFALWNCSAVEHYNDHTNEMYSHHPIAVSFTLN